MQETEDGQTLEQAAWSSYGASILGGVQNLTGRSCGQPVLPCRGSVGEGCGCGWPRVLEVLSTYMTVSLFFFLSLVDFLFSQNYFSCN